VLLSRVTEIFSFVEDEVFEALELLAEDDEELVPDPHPKSRVAARIVMRQTDVLFFHINSFVP